MDSLVLPSGATIDQLEAAIVGQLAPAECPVTHWFTTGLYIRTIQIPAGTLLTSMEHKTQHPFVITEGEIEVTSEKEGSVTYKAPYHGITQPGTRRALLAITDTVWTTYHVTNNTDIDKIAEEILEPHSNPLISTDAKNQWRLQSPPKTIE